MKEQPGHSLDEVFAELNKSADFQKALQRIKPYYDLVLQIIKRRSDLGLTQKELAFRASTYQSRISKIESAEHDIRLSTLVEIADALETEVEIRLVPLAAKTVQTDISTETTEHRDEAILIKNWPRVDQYFQKISADATATNQEQEVFL